MSTIGFAEAWHHHLPVVLRQKPYLEIPFASPAGLALMKLVAWLAGRYERGKDSRDLGLLLAHYHELGNQDRLYDEQVQLLAKVDYDLEMAGAMLLGHDVAAMCQPATKALLAEKILAQDQGETREALTWSMAKREGAAAGRVAHFLELLNCFCLGLKLR